MSNRIEFQDDRFSHPILQLDRVLINKIAAGEVIERPASVVKELMENAFDAGATKVAVVAGKAGTTLISVADDGCGIHSRQVKLAFSRHATSKITTVDDLFAVWSYGFRGEALPSIASVSHLVMTTRHFSEAEGSRIVIEGGKQIELRPASAPVGTTVEVSHLFYNTPARRKFLKSEVTESRQIIRVAERMALGKPAVAVNLMLNDRQVFDLPGNQPLGDRMAALFGIDAGAIVEYDLELGGVAFMVYLAHPDQARNDRTRICLFVNGRSVTSSTLIHAVTAGYGEFLPPGRFPLAAIYITVDPKQLDVNVHPTKAEVRLSEEYAIHDNLYRIVMKALRDWRMIPSQTRAASTSTGPSAYNQVAGPSSSEPTPSGGRHDRWPGYSQVPIQISRPVSPKALADIYTTPVSDTKPEYQGVPAPAGEEAEAFDEREITYLGKTGRQYLLFSIRGELYIVDQHAAHERILYEDALKQVENRSAVTQRLLFPETVELSGEEYLTYEAGQEALAKLGFDLGAFGHHAVIINGMPPVFRDKNPGRVLRELLDDIAQLNKAGGDLIKSTAQSLACRAAVMAGDHLSAEEVRGLLIKLFLTNNPYCCPHGRPTFIKISQEELDGRFGRT